MEHFIVSARKYRPHNFEDVVGQKTITNSLQNSIKNNHLAQALLFTGPRGVGKTSCARILAKKINQEDTTLDHEDFAFNIFELDAASNNSVDDIRNLTEQVRIPPQTGKYKVYIIDEVHMLSQAAFNAFLKTLEEPPAHAIFILATTEKHKIIPTILSRCQIFDFKRITVLDAKNYLKKIAEKEGITAEDDALHIIAQKADGAMRDALSIFDRVISFSGKNLTREAVTQNLNVLDYDSYFEMTDLLIQNNIPEVLKNFNSILAKGFEGHHFINGLASHFRDLLVVKDKITVDLLEVGDNAKKKYIEQSSKATVSFLIQSIEKANQCDLNYKMSKNKRLLVELTLMQIASITFDGEKKKASNYIIPTTFFTSVSPPIKEKKQISRIEKEISVDIEIQPDKKPTEKPKPPVLKNIEKRKSSLSLKSVYEKKVEIKHNTEVNYDNHPKDSFTEKELIETWTNYQKLLLKKGQKSIASILATNLPSIKENNEIEFTLSNNLMKDQLKQEKVKILKYIRENLNNYSIQLKIIVNEKEEKKFAYTPLEKYNKLLEKNPMLKQLKDTFQLEL